jgi:hypothetical protein
VNAAILDLARRIEIADATEDDCSYLLGLLVEKKRLIARRASAGLKVGDRVRLKNIKPKYLDGAPGTITARNGTKFTVMIDPHYNTRRYAHECRVPLGAVQAMEADA